MGSHQGRSRSQLRRLERVLPPLARRADELHVRRLRDAENQSLEAAQLNKLRSSPTSRKIDARRRRCSTSAAAGARTSSTLATSRGVKRAFGVTLSTAQAEEINARKIPGVEVVTLDFMKYETRGALRRAHLDLHDRSPRARPKRRARARPSTSTASTSRSATSSPSQGAWFGLQTSSATARRG